MSTGFFKVNRCAKAEFLARHPKECALMLLVALRAWRGGEFNPQGLRPGEAMAGDHESCGLSRQSYRTALANLQKWGFATIRPTTRGTIISISGSDIFDINEIEINHQINPQSTIQPTTNKKVRRKEDIYHVDGFAEFWAEYPRTDGKAEAAKAWAKLSEKDRPAVTAALRRHKELRWAGTEARYIPHASTWLNQERWRDEIKPQDALSRNALAPSSPFDPKPITPQRTPTPDPENWRAFLTEYNRDYVPHDRATNGFRQTFKLWLEERSRVKEAPPQLELLPDPPLAASA